MNKLLRILLIILFFTAAVCAQKNFTLKQVTTDEITLQPKKLEQLQWIPGTDDFAYVFSENETQKLYKENSDIEGRKELLTLNQLSTVQTAAGLDAADSFPKFNWISSDKIRFWIGNKLVDYNLKTNTPNIINNIWCVSFEIVIY